MAGELAGHLQGVKLQLALGAEGKQQSRQERGFIAYKLGGVGGFENRDNLRLNDYESFLKLYDTPEVYWRSVMRFVYLGDALGVQSPTQDSDFDQKRSEYSQSLQRLGEKTFGKKRWAQFVKEHGTNLVQPVVESSSITSKGEINEDNYMNPIVHDTGGHHMTIAIGAFDGVGGEKGGQMASSIASFEGHGALEMYTIGEQEFSSSIGQLIQRSRTKMEKWQTEYPTMGTTFAIAALDERDKTLKTAHGGDSKVMVIDEKGTVTFLTRDHNLAHADFRANRLSPTDYYEVTQLLDTATSEADIPQRFRKYWYNLTTEKQHKEENIPYTGRHVITNAIRGNQHNQPIQLDEDYIQSHTIQDNWVAAVALTDGVTDNLTPHEISVGMRAQELATGKITLKESLDSLTEYAKRKSNEESFRSKPDAGITATGFLF